MRSSRASGAEPRDPRGALLGRLALALGVVALIAAGWGLFAYTAWRDARARWQEMSERVLGPGYDAGESDRRYLAVEARRDELVRALETMAAASAGALGVLLWRRRRGHAPGMR
jgi:hypothetical protein